MNTSSTHRTFSRFSLLTILLVVSLLFGCNGKLEEAKHASIGGQIVNPYSNYLVLSKNGELIDTIYLDENNRFSYTIDSVEQGLYLLKHQAQTQSLYLAPGDSLLLRANTYAFDESLHFSGAGSGRNNFLAEMFLLDESNTDLLLSFHKLNPAEFLQKSDSIRLARIESLETASEKKNFIPEFQEFTKQLIEYENYDLKERYTYLVHKYFKEHYNEIPQDFHSYREDVDFNLEQLQDARAYRRFIDNYLINYSLDWCSESGIDEDDCFDLTKTSNIKARLEKASELIQLPSLKEYFLSKLGVLGLVMAPDEKKLDEILDLLSEKDFPEEELQNLESLASLQTNYMPGNVVRNVPLVTPGEEILTFGSAIKRPSIIFLWSSYNGRHLQDHQIIEEYREKYPEIDFIGINMDIGEIDQWQRTIETYGYPKKYEYQLGRARFKKEFFQYYLDKLLFLDSSGKVVIGNAFIHSPEFESRILEFLNRSS